MLIVGVGRVNTSTIESMGKKSRALKSEVLKKNKQEEKK